VLPGGDRLLVDDECSGLRSALALVALGTYVAGTARELPGARRLGAGDPADRGEAARAWHDPSTWGVYAVAIAACVLLERALRPRSRAAMSRAKAVRP